MGNQWRKIFIKPEVEGMGPEGLDYLLTSTLPAAVTQGFKDGKYFYEPDDQGRYEVRLLQDNAFARSIIDGYIAHEGFRVVEEFILEGNEVLQIINHETPEASDFPGRRK
jgi:hypothetical protein